MSETLTQMLARNPMAATGLAAGDAVRMLDVSGTGLSKDAMLTLAELKKALFTSSTTQTNASGNTTVTPGLISISHVEVIAFSGLTLTTRGVILDLANAPTAGARALVRCVMPATADITVEFRNATAGGTLLTSFVTDSSGDDKVAEFHFDGTAWQFLRFDAYATD